MMQVTEAGLLTGRNSLPASTSQPTASIQPPQLDSNDAAVHSQMDRLVNEWRQIAKENGAKADLTCCSKSNPFL